MNHKAFRQLLKKYLDNSSTDDERRIVDQWYELLEGGKDSLSEKEITEVEYRLWNKLQSTTVNKIPVIPIHKNHKSWWPYAVAASFFAVIILSITWFTVKTNSSTNESPVVAKINPGFLEEANDADTAKKIRLEDGSFVTISPGSKLSFPKHFAVNKREVYLSGDAFFSVSKNPKRPFFVYNNQIVTQVLGTSFDIHGKNGQVEVAVKTGRVAVYENKDQIELNKAQERSNGVIITPNQKVTYYQQERHFVTSIVDQPIPVPQEHDNKVAEVYFNYNEAPLYKVLDDLESTYQLEIVLEDEKIRKCLFTGDLTGQSLFNKLQGICLVFGASYEIKGTKILLKAGKECS